MLDLGDKSQIAIVNMLNEGRKTCKKLKKIIPRMNDQIGLSTGKLTLFCKKNKNKTKQNAISRAEK